MSLHIKFHESTNQILVYNCEPTIQWCKNPVSLIKGFLCYIFTPAVTPPSAAPLLHPSLPQVNQSQTHNNQGWGGSSDGQSAGDWLLVTRTWCG